MSNLPPPSEWDDWELLEALRHAQANSASVPGPAAWIIAQLWLPDGEQAEQELDERGIHGSPAAEFMREQVVAALESIRQRGDEWAAAAGGNQIVSSESQAGSAQGALDAMHEPMPTNEAADLLGISPQATRRLGERGALRATKLDGKWMFDRESVEARAERKEHE